MFNGLSSECDIFSKTISLCARLVIVKLFFSASLPCFSGGGSGDDGMTLLATLLCSVVVALFIIINDVGY